MCVSFLSLLILLSLGNSFCDRIQPEVVIKNGKVLGIRELFDGKDLNVFLGIPYAEPPIKELRFKKPLPAKSWCPPLEATKWSKMCTQGGVFSQKMMQFSNNEESEDCLYLNIWSPVVPEKVDDKSLPVLFYIHGGGFIDGSSSQVDINGTVLASKGNVVVVTFNYRLGPLGFLYTGCDEAPGNAGFYDQVLALEWVNDNIAYFGGDPNRITLVGESAGSVSVGLHLLSRYSRYMFRYASMMSGSPLVYFVKPKEEGLIAAQNLARLSNCAPNGIPISKEVVDCLRAVPAKTLSNLQFDANILDGLPKYPINLPFAPIYGTELLPQRPAATFTSGAFAQNTSLLIGTVEDEGSICLYLTDPKTNDPHNPRPMTRNNAAKLINDMVPLFGLREIKPIDVEINYLSLVPDGNDEGYRRAVGDMLGEAGLSCPTFQFAKQFAKSPNNNVYGYQINYKSQSPGMKWLAPWCAPWMGTCHGTDVPFLFGMPFRAEYSDKFSETDRQLAAEMIDIWSHFARNGKTKHFPGHFWPQQHVTASGEVIPFSYAINPLLPPWARVTKGALQLNCEIIWENHVDFLNF